jgi:hypothetical protein
MKHLIAFLGSRSGGLQKVLSTDEDIYEPQDLASNTVYSDQTLIEEGEWYTVANFIEGEFSNAFIEKGSPIDTTVLNQIEEASYEKIKYLCYENEGKKYFQKYLNSSYLKRKWFTVSAQPVFETNKNIITMSPDPDAVYDIASDTLYFKDISRVKAIFSGIDSLYQEATQAEVNSFLDNDFIEVAENYSAAQVTVPNRKRIAHLTDKIANFSDEDKEYIFKYIHEYRPEISFKKGVFNVESEDDLTAVLYGIDERYYTTDIGHEKRIANSVKTIET